MIDLHSHILPNIDDGAVDLKASITLARGYAAAGFKTVVATPHARAGEFSKDFAQSVFQAVNRLNQELRAHKIGIQVLPGMEVEVDARLPAHIASGALIPLAGNNHLLVETPFLQMPLGWQNMVNDLDDLGIVVVFAHPERCEQIIKSPKLLEEMAASGALLQVNCTSFAGMHGRQIQRLARYMARWGLIHCVATDCHDPEHRNPGVVAQVLNQLADLVGKENLERIAYHNPAQVIMGGAAQAPEIENMPQRADSMLSRWRKFLF